MLSIHGAIVEFEMTRRFIGIHLTWKFRFFDGIQDLRFFIAVGKGDQETDVIFHVIAENG